MGHKRFDLSWLLLLGLVCLFVLAVRSPRSWEQISRPQAIANPPILADSPNHPASPIPIATVAVKASEPTSEAADTGPVLGQAGSTPSSQVAVVAVPSPSDLQAKQPVSRDERADVASVAMPAAKSAEMPVEITMPAAATPALMVASTPAPILPSLPAAIQEPIAPTEEPQAAAPKESPATPIQEPPAATILRSDVAATAPLLPLPVGPQLSEPEKAATGNPLGSASAPALGATGSASVQANDATAQSDPGEAVAQDTPSNPVAATPPPQTTVELKEKVEVKDKLVWPTPDSLLALLKELASHESTAPWASDVTTLVRKLGPQMSQASKDAAETLQKLDELSARAVPLQAEVKDRGIVQSLSRADHALLRRLDAWKHICAIAASGSAESQLPTIDPQRLPACLADIDAMLRDKPERAAWEKYLGLDALRDWLAQRGDPQERVPRELATAILKRLNHPAMSLAQREFVATGPIGALRQELLRHAAEAVDAARLLRHIERFEQTGLATDARLLAEDCRFLAMSQSEDYRQLGNALDMRYRNANLRMAISAELFNRLIPRRNPEYAEVDDTVLGLPVRGQSMTSTKVSVRLLPDPARVRLALEITGHVSSLTSATSGPATFVNDSNSVYVASKPMEIDLHGIRLDPTEVNVYNQTHLREVQTDFDPIPLVGSLVNEMARSQHEQRQPEMSREVKEKIAAKAEERIDSETSSRLTSVAQRLQDKVFNPMDALDLEPTMIAGETTQQRVIMRIRLAGGDQLGSHTPRPQAPADSLASFQVHESVLNNVVQRLELDGRTFTLPELGRHIAARLSRPAPKDENPDHDDVLIMFAPKNAVRVRCIDGRIEITVSIAKLAKESRSWKDFQVRAFYRPEVNGRSAELARDGVIELSGRRLNTGAQIVLRGVFSRAFSKTTPWKLTPERLLTDPALADTSITQFVVDDGWIGVALAARRTAARPTVQR